MGVRGIVACYHLTLATESVSEIPILHLEVEMLMQMLARTVKAYAERTAIVYDESRLSYHELYTQVVGLSNGLRELGVKQSDSIALLLPNCAQFVVSFYAAASLQTTVQLLNPLFKEPEIEYYLRDNRETSVVITDRARADVCRQVISRFDKSIKIIIIDGHHSEALSFAELIQTQMGALCEESPSSGDFLIQYSSGSTGRPKKLCRTQKNLYHQALNCTATYQVTAQDSILVLVPLFHAYGLGECLLAATSTGATLVILEPVVQDGIPVEMPFVFRRQRLLDLIQKEQITILPLVPYMASVLAATPADHQADLSAVKIALSAGNFLAKDIFDKFRQRFGIPLRQLYGCTEAGAVTVDMQDESEVQYNSIGQPMVNVEITIVDEEGHSVPPGVLGELLIKSETLTSGYSNRPELNQRVFVDFPGGGFLTGDLGRKDEKGNIYLVGRKRIFIDMGGYKVDPLEVEDLLMTHPKVAEAVVVGVAHPSGSEMVKAVIVPQEECTKQEILSYCKERLADFKVPRRIEFRQEIPKSALGKVLRGKL